MRKLYRQGDVLLVAVGKLPQGAKAVAAKGRIILAYGEATGHHHSVAADCSQEWLDDAGVTWLEVKQAVELLHQEHAPVPLPVGVYRKVQQREYSPEAIRSVVD